MNKMQVFQNSEFGEISVLEIDGKPYFPATACAKVLGYAKPRNAISMHCKGALKQGALTKGGMQEITFIPEGDLYRLITHSKLPSAERFEKWVFNEVLPTIRKTGGYGQVDMTAIIMQTATAVCAEMVKQLAPVLQGSVRPLVSEEYLDIRAPREHRSRFRKRPSSIIDRLCPELRREIEEMLCDGRYTYADIVARLAQEGISVSAASVCRYAKRNDCYAAYEV